MKTVKLPDGYEFKVWVDSDFDFKHMNKLEIINRLLEYQEWFYGEGYEALEYCIKYLEKAKVGLMEARTQLHDLEKK